MEQSTRGKAAEQKKASEVWCGGQGFTFRHLAKGWPVHAQSKTQQDLTKIGCCRARNSSEMQQVIQRQKMLAFQSRQGGENC